MYFSHLLGTRILIFYTFNNLSNVSAVLGYRCLSASVSPLTSLRWIRICNQIPDPQAKDQNWGSYLEEKRIFFRYGVKIWIHFLKGFFSAISIRKNPNRHIIILSACVRSAIAARHTQCCRLLGMNPATTPLLPVYPPQYEAAPGRWLPMPPHPTNPDSEWCPPGMAWLPLEAYRSVKLNSHTCSVHSYLYFWHWVQGRWSYELYLGPVPLFQEYLQTWLWLVKKTSCPLLSAKMVLVTDGNLGNLKDFWTVKASIVEPEHRAEDLN